MEEALLFAERDNKVYIRAFGHITAAACGTLKARIFERFESSPSPDNLYVDLSSCEYMDSTFMGLLVGFNKRLLRCAERPSSVGIATAPPAAGTRPPPCPFAWLCAIATIHLSFASW